MRLLPLPESMDQSAKPIDVRAISRRVDVDNRIPLHYYYRIADTLLKQACIYREEKNIIDLYVILLRYSSLVSETIPYHRDYQSSHAKQRLHYKKKLLVVLDELEALKPEFHYRVNELNRASDGVINAGPGFQTKQLQPANQILEALPEQNKYQNQGSISWASDRKSQKLAFNLLLPKQETLSRHSFFGPNGLRSQWQAPSTEMKVHYPSHVDVTPVEDPGLIQPRENAAVGTKERKPEQDSSLSSLMEDVLSLNDGSWSHPVDESSSPLTIEGSEDFLPQGNIRILTPPPVLAQVHPQVRPLSPSRVADPRPGPAKSSSAGIPGSDSYQYLHIPVRMMEDFLRLAKRNTEKNLETCGVLAGSLKNRVFHITTLIIPKQESTSDSCQTQSEEEIFEVQDKLSLFPLGWIHTHPSQTCFMSSVDLHTHYSYQIMLPEAIAIVMAPTDASSPHGIFHLSDPGGLSVIRNCQQRGFHPHEEPSDGSPLYEHCSHVYMNPKLRFDVVDLR